jgi:hypothetical protein
MSFSSEISTDDNTGQIQYFFFQLIVVAKFKTLQIVDSGLDTGAPLQKIQLIISFLTIASAILVLIVVCQNGRHCLLLPGLIFHAVLAVIGFVFTFYYAVLHYNEQDNDTGKNYLLACFGIAGTYLVEFHSLSLHPFAYISPIISA